MQNRKLIEKQKRIFTSKDLCGMQKAFYLAKKMGKGLERSKILQ